MNGTCPPRSVDEKNDSWTSSLTGDPIPMHWTTVLYILSVCIPTTIIMFFTIVGNILVLLARAHVGQRITRLFVVNLAIADLLVGSVVLPMSVTNLVLQSWPFGRTLCRLWVFSDIVFCTASIVTICMISIDRYMAVARPLKYRALITKRKCVFAIILVWTISLTVLLATVRWTPPKCVDATFCFVGNELQHLTHSVVFAFFVPAFVTLTLYWKIYIISRNRQRAIDSGFMVVFGKNMNFLTSHVQQEDGAMRIHKGPNEGGRDIVQQQRHVLQSHQRLALTLGLVSCAFLFCWLPFFSLYLISWFDDSRCACIPGLVLDACTWIGYCNSAINPIIYAFTIKDFKQNVQLMLRPWLLCSSDKPLTSLSRLQPAMSPGQMARLLAGHVDNQNHGHELDKRHKRSTCHDINNWHATDALHPDATPLSHRHASVHTVNTSAQPNGRVINTPMSSSELNTTKTTSSIKSNKLSPPTTVNHVLMNKSNKVDLVLYSNVNTIDRSSNDTQRNETVMSSEEDEDNSRPSDKLIVKNRRFRTSGSGQSSNQSSGSDASQSKLSLRLYYTTYETNL